jgi:hypothetical protein
LPSSERHGVTNEDEVLEELGRNVFVRPPVFSQLKGNVEHAQTVESHPARTVSLLQSAPGWKRLGAVEEANVVETQEAPFEDILAVQVFAIYPPREIQE